MKNSSWSVHDPFIWDCYVYTGLLVWISRLYRFKASLAKKWARERKGTNMGHTVILATIYFPLITVGMVWVIVWSLSAEGPHSK